MLKTKTVAFLLILFISSCQKNDVPFLSFEELDKDFISEKSKTSEKYTFARDVSEAGSAIMLCSKNLKPFLISVNLKNGNIQWEIPFSVSGLDIYVGDNNYGIFYFIDKFVVVNLKNGNIQMEYKMTYTPNWLRPFKFENIFYIVESSNKNLLAFDLASKKIWENPINDIIDYVPATSPYLIDKNILTNNNFTFVKSNNNITTFETKTGKKISNFDFKSKLSIIAEQGQNILLLHNGKDVYKFNPSKNDTTKVFSFETKYSGFKFFLAKKNQLLILHDYTNIYGIDMVLNKLIWVYDKVSYQSPTFENGYVYHNLGGFRGGGISDQNTTTILDAENGSIINQTVSSSELLPYRHYNGSLFNDVNYFIKIATIKDSTFLIGFNPKLDKQIWKYKIPKTNVTETKVDLGNGAYPQKIYFPLLKKAKNGIVTLNQNNEIEYFDFVSKSITLTSSINSIYKPIIFYDIIE